MQSPRTCLAASLANDALLVLDVSTTGQELALAPPVCAPPRWSCPPAPNRGRAWLLGAVGAPALVPAWGGVMLMLLPIPQLSRAARHPLQDAGDTGSAMATCPELQPGQEVRGQHPSPAGRERGQVEMGDAEHPAAAGKCHS